MTHPDDLAGADVFDVPGTSLSPTDPAQVVPWLRALPLGSVLLDNEGDAWQSYGGGASSPYFLGIGSLKVWSTAIDDDMAQLAAWGPFRAVWTSGGGR